MSFFDMSPEELAAAEPMFFTAKVPVEFTVLSVNEQPKFNSIGLVCNVGNGDHAGKSFTMKIQGGDNPQAKQKKAEFLLAMWTKEELNAGKATLDTLIGTKFQCRPEAPFESKSNGKMYQNFQGYLKLESGINVAKADLPF
jgi:hypothetical protein